MAEQECKMFGKGCGEALGQDIAECLLCAGETPTMYEECKQLTTRRKRGNRSEEEKESTEMKLILKKKEKSEMKVARAPMQFSKKALDRKAGKASAEPAKKAEPKKTATPSATTKGKSTDNLAQIVRDLVAQGKGAADIMAHLDKKGIAYKPATVRWNVSRIKAGKDPKAENLKKSRPKLNLKKKKK